MTFLARFTWLAAAAAAGATLLITAAGAQTLGLQDLPDDTRATVKKELARRYAEPRAPADASRDAPPSLSVPGSRGECSMNIGSTEAQGAHQRKVVVVATKPVVQICK